MNQNMPFNVFLLISILGHASFALSGKILPVAPQFAVTQAPISIEVALVEEIKPQVEIQEQIKEEEIGEVVEHQVIQEELREEEISSAQNRGSLAEAKPLEYQNRPPIYPRMARQKGWEGKVILKVLVERSGLASQIFVEETSGYQVLDEAAVLAVKKWRFIPAQTAGMQFSSWIKIPIKFILERKGD